MYYQNPAHTPFLTDDDLVDNPTPRVPVSLCLDCSGSMQGDPICELNEGIATFYREVYADEIARYAAEVGVVTFGGKAEVVAPFQTLDCRPEAPVLDAGGGTPLAEALKLSLDSLESRKAEYRKNGVDYYQPWLVVMTDGMPTGDMRLLEEQVDRVARLVEQRKLVVFPIGIGSNADMGLLARVSPGRTPLRLRGLCFTEFFQWLSASMSRVSQSTPGDRVTLDIEGIRGWGEL